MGRGRTYVCTCTLSLLYKNDSYYTNNNIPTTDRPTVRPPPPPRPLGRLCCLRGRGDRRRALQSRQKWRRPGSTIAFFLHSPEPSRLPRQSGLFRSSTPQILTFSKLRNGFPPFFPTDSFFCYFVFLSYRYLHHISVASWFNFAATASRESGRGGGSLLYSERKGACGTQRRKQAWTTKVAFFRLTELEEGEGRLLRDVSFRAKVLYKQILCNFLP